jgi:hypothetical protein
MIVWKQTLQLLVWRIPTKAIRAEQLSLEVAADCCRAKILSQNKHHVKAMD